ncbi:MAG TPA: PhoX family phosphatase [Micropepsaceae bacterium]|nr:PhoX family phosphatase [Micropepsaceae bacterium]
MQSDPGSLMAMAHARLSRRQFLSGAGSLGLAAAAGPLLSACADESVALAFEPIAHVLDETHHVARGYSARVLARWGDGVTAGAPPFDPRDQTGAAQAAQFGFNCDFIGYLPLSDDASSGPAAHFASNNSRHGILCVNHEYVSLRLMHPGLASSAEAAAAATAERVAAEMAAVGVSIIEIADRGNGFEIVNGSSFARRIHASTPMAITGPARGHKRMQTPDDPAGETVLGTMANCSGAITPWGTMLTAEENFHVNFICDPASLPDALAAEKANAARMGIEADTRMSWHRYHPRFDMENAPMEPNRFGWIVEIDPYDPAAMPKKRTAMGRFKHENAAIVAEPGKPVVAYMGDDESGEFLYRFISKGIYEPANRAANMNLLEDGTLSCAQFAKDGTGRWLKMTAGEGPLVPANRIQDAADVLIDARRAARLLEATPMDRPEDAEVSPVTGKVFIALTSHNSRREKIPASSRGPNPYGHILEIVPPGEDGGRDHWADHFTWNLFIEAGDPSAGDDAMKPAYGGVIDPSGWFANPDNLAFDPKGRLWIATDGANDFGIADGLWAVVTEGEGRAVPRAFFACPRGAEACGPCFTPDGRTLFVAVQHPADETGSTFDAPSTRWPDFDPALPPRPAVVVITKDDGGAVGG